MLESPIFAGDGGGSLDWIAIWEVSEVVGAVWEMGMVVVDSVEGGQFSYL
jgi:hypothetical protein